MTKLTNKDRTEFIENTLNAAFDLRFDIIQDRINDFGRKWLESNHPHFLELRKNKHYAQYLYVHSGLTVKFDESPVVRPVDYATCDCSVYASRVRSIKHGLTRIDCKIDYPARIGNSLQCDDEQLVKEYHTIWTDLIAAKEKLTTTIYSYAIREKFEQDFPHLVKYLPPTVKKVITAVALPVKDLTEELKRYGIK